MAASAPSGARRVLLPPTPPAPGPPSFPPSTPPASQLGGLLEADGGNQLQRSISFGIDQSMDRSVPALEPLPPPSVQILSPLPHLEALRILADVAARVPEEGARVSDLYHSQPEASAPTWNGPSDQSCAIAVSEASCVVALLLLSQKVACFPTHNVS